MQELLDCLDEFNFQKIDSYGTHSGHPSFLGLIELSSGLQVKIHLRFPEGELGFPVLKLIEWHNGQFLRDKLEMAHIQSDGTICHSDSSKTWWDSSDAVGSLNLVFQRTLEILDKNEQGGESLVEDFQAYWGADENLFFHPKNYQRNTLYELLTYDVENKLSRSNTSWIVREGQIPNWLNHGVRSSTVFFSLDFIGEPKILPNANWPPKNCADLFKFLSAGNTDFTNILCKQICYQSRKLGKKRSNELFDPKQKKATPIALLMRWNKESASTIGVKTWISQQAVQSLVANRHLGLGSILKTSNEKLIRYSIEQANPSYLFSKKQISSENNSLEGKSILLIGCGAIGGYLTQQLVGLGAGLSKGSITICDFDVLKLDNISRHALGLNSVGEYKAKALMDDMLQKYPYINIESIIGSHASLNTKSIIKHDLIINATGSMEVGIAIHQRLKNIKIRPPVIHSWVHGQGLAAVTFLSLKSPCFRCLWHIQNQELKFRFEISKFPNDDKIVEVGCHNSFMPYPSHAAISAATLTSKCIQQWLDNTLITTLNFEVLRPDRCLNVNDKTPSKLKLCPICS